MIRTNGFLCYAHRDGESPSRKYVEELKLHLNQIQPGHSHRAWSDQDIRDGDDWPTEVRQALDQAAYAVLFVNIEFLNSDFVQQIELPDLLEAAQRDGLLILALRVGDCLLPDWPARIQFSNLEEGNLHAVRRPKRDGIYTALANRVSEHLRGRPVQSQAVRLMRQVAPIGTREPGRQLVDAAMNVESSSAPDLADILSQRIAGELKRIREQYQRGERQNAVAAIETLLVDAGWSALAPALRGRILRTASLYRLADGNIEGASELADRAARDDPVGDEQVFAAHLAARTEGPIRALEILHEPRSWEARHLKAAVLIEVGNAEGALTALDLDAPGMSSLHAGDREPCPNDAYDEETGPAPGNAAETYRLRAIALLALRRLTDAEDAIQRADSLATDWLAVRTTKALVSFWRACTPAALSFTEQPLWPMPFPRGFVRADGSSAADLSAAQEAFAAAARASVEGSPLWEHWLTWRMIALLATGAHDEDARRVAEQLLGDNGPLRVWPLLWASAYGVGLDRERLKQRLSAVDSDDPNYVLLRGLFFEMCLEDGEVDTVLADLPAAETVLADMGQQEIARHWRVAACVAAERFEDARVAADGVSNERTRLRLHLVIARAREKDNPGAYHKAAAALLAIDSGIDVLAEACEAHASAGEWAFVADHGDALLEAIPTPDSLRKLVSATWNLGDYPRCLSALDEHRHVYLEGRLPQDLVLLRVRCQRMLGDLSGAMREARLLYEQDPSAENLIALGEAQLQSGDAAGIRQSLRRIVGTENLPGDFLIHAAELAHLTGDRELAVLLWRRATESGSDNVDFPTKAAITGSALGLGEETAYWFRRMAESARSGVGHTIVVHVSEMVELVRSQREEIERVEQLYRRGEIPVHVLPANGFPLLSALFHQIPENNRRDPDSLKQVPVLVRHGARPLNGHKLSGAVSGRLVLDLTALITAASLSSPTATNRVLLDLVEAQLQPLYLPTDWHALLLEEIRYLQPTQPERLAADREVAEMVRAGAIEIVNLSGLPEPPEDLVRTLGDSQARVLSHASVTGSCLVDFLPLRGPDLTSPDNTDLPNGFTSCVIGPRALLDLVLSEGLIDGAVHERARSRFDPDPPGFCCSLGTRSRVLISMGVLNLLANDNLLPVLSRRFRLAVADVDWRRTEAELAGQKENEHLISWLQALIRRVAAGLSADIYRIAPTHRPPSGTIPQGARGLDNLLHYPGEPGDLIWVDDRHINGYPTSGTSHIVGVVEVLSVMLARKAVTESEHFRWLYQLRASNYRYIPLDAEEILYWLAQTRVHTGTLVVPTQLETIARYWAACLYPVGILQWERDEIHANGEIPFIVSSLSAISRVFAAIWTDRQLGMRRRRQRADWVLDNLLVGVGDIGHLVPETGPDWATKVVGMDTGYLIFGSFQVAIQQLEKQSAGAQLALADAEVYLGWVCERIVVPRLLADPDAVMATAKSLRDMIVGTIPATDERQWRLIGSWMLGFLKILPSTLRDELHKDQALMQRLGLEEVVVAEFDGLCIEGRKLWQAVESALRGRTRILDQVGKPKPLTLRLVSEPECEEPKFALSDAKGRVLVTRSFEYAGILSASRRARLSALRRNPHWWDGWAASDEEVDRELTAIHAPEVRIRRLHAVAGMSADSHYFDLKNVCCHETPPRLEHCLPPSLTAVLSYIRCPMEAVSEEPLAEACWADLVRSVPPVRGPLEALRRIALLPCSLPDAVRALIRDLDPSQAIGMIGDLRAALKDPVGRLHLIDLLLTIAEICPEALAAAQEEVDYLTGSRFESDWQVTNALTEVAYRAFEHEERSNAIPAAVRLMAAWAHASRVTGILLAHGAHSGRLGQALRKWAPMPNRDLYALGSDPMLDLAWPWQVGVPDIVLVAFGGVLSRHPEISAKLDLTTTRNRVQCLLSGNPEPAEDAHLLADPSLRTDMTKCLWGGDRSEKLTAFVAREDVSVFSPAAFAIRLDTVLSHLETDPNRFDLWRNLWIVVRQGRLPSDQLSRLAAIVPGLDIDRVSKFEPLLLAPVMELVINHSQDTGAILDQIFAWVDGLDSGDQPPPAFVAQFGADSRKKYCEFIVHWLHSSASRHQEDPDAEFGRLLEKAVLGSRTLAAHLRQPLVYVVRHLPFARHRSLRRVLLAARARPLPAGKPLG